MVLPWFRPSSCFHVAGHGGSANSIDALGPGASSTISLSDEWFESQSLSLSLSLSFSSAVSPYSLWHAASPRAAVQTTVCRPRLKGHIGQGKRAKFVLRQIEVRLSQAGHGV